MNSGHILFLNKKDLLAEKLSQSPFSPHFDDFIGPETYNEVSNYIRQKYEDITTEKATDEMAEIALYTHFTCATNRQNVSFTFQCIQDMIVQEALNSVGMK